MSLSASGEQIEEIKRLHLEGKSGAEIAAEIGLSYTTVNRYRRKMGLPSVKRDYSRQRKREPVKQTVHSGMCDGYCIGCVYLTEVLLNGRIKACHYIIYTGKKRPCPAGTGCTEKKIGKMKPKLIDVW